MCMWGEGERKVGKEEGRERGKEEGGREREGEGERAFSYMSICM